MEAFLDARGLEAWEGEDLPDEELGSEHAAEVLAWGLTGDAILIREMPYRNCATLAEAFRLLTGVEPITGANEATPTDR